MVVQVTICVPIVKKITNRLESSILIDHDQCICIKRFNNNCLHCGVARRHRVGTHDFKFLSFIHLFMHITQYFKGFYVCTTKNCHKINLKLAQSLSCMCFWKSWLSYKQPWTPVDSLTEEGFWHFAVRIYAITVAPATSLLVLGRYFTFSILRKLAIFALFCKNLRFSIYVCFKLWILENFLRQNAWQTTSGRCPIW